MIYGAIVKNKKISAIFNEIALMLSIDERPNSRFEIRAYQRAALAISSLQEPIEEIYKSGGMEKLMEMPGVGRGLASKIAEYLDTGKIKKYDELKDKYPIDFGSLTQIEGMGAKRAYVLYEKLGIKDINGLKAALKKHNIRDLDGFGEKSEELLSKGIIQQEKSKGRILLGDALPVAESMIKSIKESGYVDLVVLAGSARRMRETVGDIDILALSEKPDEAMEFFTKLPNVTSVVVSGHTKTTVWLDIGITCDLRIIPSASFGAAVQYFTGSKDHNIKVRTIAVSKGYKLNEYGLYGSKNRLIESGNEQTIYELLGMDYVEPEMREDRGEIHAAQEHRLPKLVNIEDIKGDMHTHTIETDGANTIEEIAQEAIRLGYQYINTTNHTKSLAIAKGMDERGFERFFEHVDDLNETYDGKLRILKGAEIDILKDGSLDLEKRAIESMDCPIGAVHTSMKMDRNAMTLRIIRALDTGMLKILAHPTGRELPSREPYEFDMEKVLEAAERNNVALEINSQPSRLDLNDTNILSASKYKVKFSIGTDAHMLPHIGFMRYGVGTARRGWLENCDIINTMDLPQIKKYLNMK